MTEPDEFVTYYLKCRRERDQAQEFLDDAQEKLMDHMQADQRKSYRWDAEGVRHTVTFVQSHVTRIDERGLRKALRAKVFDQYTKRVLDRKAMEKAMDSGEVDPLVVSKYVTLQPNVPHVSYKATPAREAVNGG